MEAETCAKFLFWKPRISGLQNCHMLNSAMGAQKGRTLTDLIIR